MKSLGTCLPLALLFVFLLAQCSTPPPPQMSPDKPIEVVEPRPPKDDPEQAHRPRTTCPPGMAGSC